MAWEQRKGQGQDSIRLSSVESYAQCQVEGRWKSGGLLQSWGGGVTYGKQDTGDIHQSQNVTTLVLANTKDARCVSNTDSPAVPMQNPHATVMTGHVGAAG